jgi:C-terminal processing protease CtpA/Prc
LAVIALACRTESAMASDQTSENQATEFVADLVGLAQLLADHHFEPPAKQQVVLLAARELYEARRFERPPADLVERCSGAVTNDEFTAILLVACGDGFSVDSQLRTAITEALAPSIPGGLQLLSVKDNEVQQQLAENRYVGLGITASVSTSQELEIHGVVPNGPMARANVPSGTVIREIDGWATQNQPMGQCVERLRGPEGTAVKLVIVRPDESAEETLTLYRGLVPRKMLSVDFEQVGERRIAIIRPQQITASTPHELQQFAETAGQLDGIVLDLRNVGGPAHFAALIADQFLDGGAIGFIRRRNRRTPLNAGEGELFPSVPLAIATSKSSTGGAAWLAATLRERKRAVVFGQDSDQQNLDSESFNLPSGKQSATFMTRVLESPSGVSTLMISDAVQAVLLDAAGLEATIDRSQRGLPPAAMMRESANRSARDSLLIAKEYFKSRPR